MKIAVVNDNTKKLKLWREVVGENISTFSHPSLFLYDVNKNNENYDLVILDRMFHEHDVLEDKTATFIRKACPGVKIALSSALHNDSEMIEGFDEVLGQWPICLEDLIKKFGDFRCNEN